MSIHWIPGAGTVSGRVFSLATAAKFPDFFIIFARISAALIFLLVVAVVATGAFDAVIGCIGSFFFAAPESPSFDKSEINST